MKTTVKKSATYPFGITTIWALYIDTPAETRATNLNYVTFSCSDKRYFQLFPVRVCSDTGKGYVWLFVNQVGVSDFDTSYFRR